MPDYLFWSLAVATVAIVALSKSGLLGSLGMVGVPLLSLVMPAREAAGMLLPLLCVMDLIGLLAFRREVDWRNVTHHAASAASPARSSAGCCGASLQTPRCC